MNQAQIRVLELQRSDGGWGAAPAGVGSTELTALSVMALEGVDRKAAARGLEWLRARQRKDGGWPITEAVPMSGWATSLAVLAIRSDSAGGDRARRGAQWLLHEKGRPVRWITRLFFRLFPRYNVVELELDLKGWPWYSGTFGWVEPTACALIALKTMRAELPLEETASRIDEGERLLIDRVCREGGWNYGNSRVYEEELWPYPDTTALALMALQDRSDRPEVPAGLAALKRMLRQNHSVLATSLGILCYRAHGMVTSGLEERLIARLEGKPAWADVRALALAALALDPAGTLGGPHA